MCYDLNAAPILWQMDVELHADFFNQMIKKKFIIWGLLDYQSRTHGYIHNAVFHAAKELGFEVHWFDDAPLQYKADLFENCIFWTAGMCDTHIPIVSSSMYILHNVDRSRYATIPEKHKLIIQVYTTDVLARDVIPLKHHKFQFWQPTNNAFYMPWATDLLPSVIQEQMKKVASKEIPNLESKKGFFVGYPQHDGVFADFTKGLKGLTFESGSLDQSRILDVFDKVAFAPTIMNSWQTEHNYIPCRIFKTISYGHLPITNNLACYELFSEYVLYHPDVKEIARRIPERLADSNLHEKILHCMKDVMNNHTYLNRLRAIFFIFQLKFNL